MRQRRKLLEEAKRRRGEFDSALGELLPELSALEERCEGVRGEGGSQPEKIQEQVEAMQVRSYFMITSFILLYLKYSLCIDTSLVSSPSPSFPSLAIWLTRLTLLQAAGSWARAWERGYIDTETSIMLVRLMSGPFQLTCCVFLFQD